jgi:hypothetical protein
VAAKPHDFPAQKDSGANSLYTPGQALQIVAAVGILRTQGALQYYFAHLNSSLLLKPCLIEIFCLHIRIQHKNSSENDLLSSRDKKLNFVERFYHDHDHQRTTQKDRSLQLSFQYQYKNICHVSPLDTLSTLKNKASLCRKICYIPTRVTETKNIKLIYES